jgi:carbon monoxide dehydrogenase subunit G
MSAYRAQAHIDAPLDDVWALVGNPATYPAWWPVAAEIRGETFEVGDVYTQVVEIAGRQLEYSRTIDRRDEFKELSRHDVVATASLDGLQAGRSMKDLPYGGGCPTITLYSLYKDQHPSSRR